MKREKSCADLSLLFKVSTFTSLLRSPRYDKTRITLLDTHLPSLRPPVADDPSSPAPPGENYPPQNPNGASIDSSRIVRPDYAIPAYARLATAAQEQWRGGYGCCASCTEAGAQKSTGACKISNCVHEPVYRECGLALTAAEDLTEYVGKSNRNTRSLGLNVQDLPNAGEIAKVMDGSEAGAQRSATRQDILGDEGGNSEAPGLERTSFLGAMGYVNWNSGWVNNGRAMANAMIQTMGLSSQRNQDPTKGHVGFVSGRVSHLLYGSPSERQDSFQNASSKPFQEVEGVVLAEPDARHIKASLTILATGAHTPSFLDLRSHVQATAQSAIYIPLTAVEAAAFEHVPVLLNLTTGLFFIPPVRRTARTNSSTSSMEKSEKSLIDFPFAIKVARHTYGYINPTAVTLPYPDTNSIGESTSTPSSFSPSIPPPSTLITPSFATPHPVPPSAIPPLLAHLRNAMPRHPALSRLLEPAPLNADPTDPDPNKLIDGTRLCFYTDTPTGDFLLTHHPDHPGLFLATGGSGHGFKFLPVLGDKIIAAVEGRLDEEEQALWGWRDRSDVQRKKEGTTAMYHGGNVQKGPKEGFRSSEWEEGWGTEDGSRSGTKGVRLVDALADIRPTANIKPVPNGKADHIGRSKL